jgi:hypothetical protein
MPPEGRRGLADCSPCAAARKLLLHEPGPTQLVIECVQLVTVIERLTAGVFEVMRQHPKRADVRVTLSTSSTSLTGADVGSGAYCATRGIRSEQRVAWKVLSAYLFPSSAQAKTARAAGAIRHHHPLDRAWKVVQAQRAHSGASVQLRQRQRKHDRSCAFSLG